MGKLIPRSLAYVVDFIVSVKVFVYLTPLLEQYVPPFARAYQPQTFYGHGETVVTLLFVVIFLGLLAGAVGRTPGMVVMALKIQTPQGTRIGVAAGILREITKLLCLTVLVGTIWALYGFVVRERPFYDDWFGCQVVPVQPKGIIASQESESRADS